MEFNLYDELPLFGGEQLVDFSPLADELPPLAFDDLPPVSDLPSLYTEEPLVKDSLLELPKEEVYPELPMVYLDTNLELDHLIQDVSSPAQSGPIEADTQSKQISPDFLLKVSEVLLASAFFT
eukprot:TRINITY_DN31922_c0_g1_i1.p1 TRINITY_DN31922_c0_g1~~TRINITY_DN31922_c0_g1_i1.p1  ORF type:complete len:123 (+),score=15.65 TRINITY_DN31922_c0_g1_i1:199-567(+)